MKRHRRWLPRVWSLPGRAWRVVRFRVPRRLRSAVLVLVLFLAIGSSGYRVIEGPQWSWFDGLYMTGITLTTLGYGEVHPLSTPGRVFTLFLAFGGIFILFYLGIELVRLVVTGEIRELVGRERMEAELAGLAGHLIVCGFGRMGRIVSAELERQRKRFVVIDKDVQPIADWPFRYGVKIHGDATEDDVLRKARAGHAAALITVVASDAENLYISLSARLLNPKLWIIARAEEEAAEVKLRKVGANKVISPYLTGGHRAVQAALRPTALDFIDLATRSEFLDLQIEEIKVAPGSRLAGRTVAETRLHQDLGILFVGILRPSGELEYNPAADAKIEAGATLVALGQRKHLDELERQAGVTSSAPRG